MSSLSVSAVLLLATLFYHCDSRSYNSPIVAPSGSKIFGLSPTFAATRSQVPWPRRVSRSVNPVPSSESKPTESDALSVDDFIARNGLDFGKGDEADIKDEDVLPQKQRKKRADDDIAPPAGNDLSWLLEQDDWEKVDDADLDWENVAVEELDMKDEDLLLPQKQRRKREDDDTAPPVGNELSWLLEQDAWEKVDDADLDWENVAAEEFDVEKALSREAREVVSTEDGVDGDNENAEEAIDALMKNITVDLKDIGQQIKGMRLGASTATAEGPTSQQGDDEEEPKVYLDPSVWRRKRSADNEVVEIQGRIDMEFESKPVNPTATVIIQKDTDASETPEMQPPIYFCGTKTDPNNPGIEVSETVAAPPGAYKKIIESLKSKN